MKKIMSINVTLESYGGFKVKLTGSCYLLYSANYKEKLECMIVSVRDKPILGLGGCVAPCLVNKNVFISC